MSSEEVGARGTEAQFWKAFPAMADYFSPGIEPLLNYLGLSSKQVMHEMGEMVGRSAAEKLSGMTAREMLEEFASMWGKYRIGTLSIERTDPLVLQITNCAVCGQLQGTAEMYECAFHEGFFQGALSGRLGRPVSLRQQMNYAGEAGTWCRRLTADVSL
jgi:predicted hydrocarbon binding protein